MTARRYHDLDFVRAFAMLLGVVLHVCIFFLPPRMYNWWSGEYQGDEANLQLLNFIHLFRMQLFFLMAGFFAELVIERKGLAQLTRDRLKRIVLPFIVGVVILAPVTMVILGGLDGIHVNNFEERPFAERFLPYFLFGSFESDGPFWDGLIHFWFLYYLILFYAIPLRTAPPLQADRDRSCLRHHTPGRMDDGQPMGLLRPRPCCSPGAVLPRRHQLSAEPA